MVKRRKLQQGRQARAVATHKGAKGAPNPHAAGRRRNGPGPGPAPSHSTHGMAKSKGKAPQHQQAPVIPFSPDESILLVGEGDLSFARSLVEHHGCTNVTATVPEKDLAELVEKYPHVAENVAVVESSSDRNNVLFGVDARKMGPFVDKQPIRGELEEEDEEEEEEEEEDEKEEEEESEHEQQQKKKKKKKKQPQPKKRKAGGQALKDRILFNFPHVGGKSTDVNRQVRYNQELLVDFFKRADRCLSPGGSIVVTLFEGEPYTLWNVRDLARHSGLQVERSFAFRADVYPGYHHARTLGVVRSKSGELGGGWKGEERAARSYIFYRKDEVPKPVVKKRKHSAGSDDSDGLEEESDDGV